MMTEEFAAAAAAGLSGDKQEKDGDLGSHMEVAAAAGLSGDKQEKDGDLGSHTEVAAAAGLSLFQEKDGVSGSQTELDDAKEKEVAAMAERDIAQHAIDRHNKKRKDGQLKLERVVKVIYKKGAWMHLDVTLEAFDTADQQVKTYQALLATIPSLGGDVLKMFRLKPSSSETQQEKKHPLRGCCCKCYRKEEETGEYSGPESESESESETGESESESESETGEYSGLESESESCHSPPLKKPKIDSSDEVEKDSVFGDSTVEQERDTQLPSGDDQDGDDEPHGDNQEEFIPYLEQLQACIERNDQLFNNLSDEETFQKFTELFEKEAGRSEKVKYTLENVETYYEELEESEGFDITHFPDMESLCFVTPVMPPWDDCVTKHVELAIEILNKKEGASFELLEITKVNYLKMYRCSHSYITFNVKVDADGECMTCQARVLTIPGREKVEEVRLKPCKS